MIAYPTIPGAGKKRESPMEFSIHPIGVVQSSLKDLDDCPHQGDEGAPEAWIELDPHYSGGLEGIQTGDEVIILTWFHLADRSTLRVHPRGDQRNPLAGVFKTRSPDRPNPIGIHRTTVIRIEAPARLLVKPLECVDGTPVLDIKCVLRDV